MAVYDIEEPPVKDLVAISGPGAERFTVAAKKPLVKWLSSLVVAMIARPSRVAHVRLTAQGASLATTPLQLGSIPPGAWRVSIQVRVSRAGTVSSEIQATVTWTQGGVTQTESTANLTTNTPTTREGMTIVMRPDDGTPIQYATTYASAGATAMQYEIDITAEQVALDATNE